jgi:GGDEF domain-containing protein
MNSWRSERLDDERAKAGGAFGMPPLNGSNPGRTWQQVQAELGELHAVTAKISSALTRVFPVSQGDLSSWDAARQRLGNTLQPDDVRTIKEKLDECLVAVEAWDIQFGSNGANDSAILPEGVRDADTDAVTGLPGKIRAQEAMEQAIQSGHSWVAVPAVVDRIETVNARFGSKAGDELLLATGQTLAKRLERNDQLFRWDGAGFVALLQRSSSLASVRLEVARLLGVRMDHTTTIRARTVLLPVTLSWTVLPLGESATVERLIQQINDFSLRNLHL